MSFRPGRLRYGRISEGRPLCSTSTGRHLYWLLTQGVVTQRHVRGRGLGKSSTVGYLRAFRVVATSVEEAFAMALEAEVEVPADTIALADWELLEPDVGAASGVAYARDGRSYYPSPDRLV